MKRILLPLLMLLVTGMLFSCKKKDTETETPYSCATCSRTPQALAANDNIAKGIYKGTVVGSSGTISFDLANNGTTMTAVMTLDGTVVNLTASITYTSGAPIIGAFTGTLNGAPVTINFSVAADGSTPIVTSSSIPGHPNAVFQIYKETSTSLIEAFEGTYSKPSSSGTETGTFNILVARSIGLIKGIAGRTGSTSAPAQLTGTINSAGAMSFSQAGGANVTGTASGDSVNGSIVDSYGTGSFTGHRTL